MKKFSIVFILVLAAFSATIIDGCGTPAGPAIPLKSGEMQATINGSSSFDVSNAQATDGASSFFVSASLKDESNNDSLGISLNITKGGVPPFTITTDNDDLSSIIYCIVHPDGSCTKYVAKKGTGSATIKITETSPTLQGTFSGSLQLEGGSGSISITDGAFNAFF